MDEWYSPVSEPDITSEKRNISRLCMGFALMIIITMLLQLLLGRLLPRVWPSLAYSQWFVWILAMVPMYFVGAPVCLLVTRKCSRTQLAGNKMSVKGFIVCLVMCFGLLYPMNLVGAGVNAAVNALLGKENSNQLLSVITYSDLWITGIFTVIVAPTLEELMFRRLLAGRLSRYGEGTAVVVSGLMFGLYHGNFSQFFYAAGLGMLFAYIYLKTGRIITTILLHACVNFTGSVLPLIFFNHIDMDAIYSYSSQLRSQLPWMAGMVVFYLLLLALTVIGAVLIISRRKRFKVSAGEVTLPRDSRAKTIMINVGMLLFIAACAAMFVISYI